MKKDNKGVAIRNGLREGFADGTAKMANRKCYGYRVAKDGTLVIYPLEAENVVWIFTRYARGDSLGKIVTGLGQKGVPSPTGKGTWSRECVKKILSNEKYTGRVLLQKTYSVGNVQKVNDGVLNQYLYEDNHPGIIEDELFRTVQEQMQKKSKKKKMA